MWFLLEKSNTPTFTRIIYVILVNQAQTDPAKKETSSFLEPIQVQNDSK